jgi:menaquinone-dependent protoporphyrinogen oxidase
MSVLIVYRSKYGTTAECARELASGIGGDTEVADLSHARVPPLGGFDTVLIGASIYGGKVHRSVTAFCEREQELLRQRRVGLFLCCLYRGERAAAQLRAAFPEWLAAHAFTQALFGGALRLDRLTLGDRILVRAVQRPLGEVSLVDHRAIGSMAEAVRALGSGGGI